MTINKNMKEKMKFKGLEIFLLFFISPIFLFTIYLKTVRLMMVRPRLDLIEIAGMLQPELLFLTGYTILWYLMLSLRIHRLIRWLALGTMLLSFMLIATIEFVSHNYYIHTLETDFGIDIVYFFFKNMSSMVTMAASVLSEKSLIIFSIFLLLVLLYLVKLFKLKPLDHQKFRPGWKLNVILFLISVAAIILSPYPNSDSARLYPRLYANSSFKMIHSVYAKRATHSPFVSTFEFNRSGRISGSGTGQNLVIIMLESLRLRSTSMKSQLDTTPFLKQLSESDKAIVAEQAHAVVTHTTNAVLSILCGIEPHPNSYHAENTKQGIPVLCLPALLAQKGYRTVFFQPATKFFEDREGLVNNMGFQDFYAKEHLSDSGFETVNYFGKEEFAMLPVSKRWLQSNRKNPFFAAYLTLSSHHPYTTPKWFKKQAYTTDDALNSYLNSIRYTDLFLEKLIDQYKALGLYENTAFIIVGDHGQGFMEHGRIYHNSVIYNEGLRVPLVILDPKKNQSRRTITKRFNQLDILPTAVQLLGFSQSGGNYRGQSILGDFEQRDLFAQCWNIRNGVTIIRDRWKYIYVPDTGQEELFDIDSDPFEKVNLIQEKPALAETLRQALLFWKSKVEFSYK